MKLPILQVCCLFVFVTGCKSTNLIQPLQTKTIQQVSLGSIGSEKEFLLQRGFNNIAIPNYKVPIKLSVITKPFNKQTYKGFAKAKTLQSADVKIIYIDSIPNKPKYIQLQIADKVGVIKALNSNKNDDVKAYLSHNTNAQVLSSISIALNHQEIEAITNADAVFLVENGFKTYGLQLYKNKVKTQMIFFNEGVVFEYRATNCCWQENEKRDLDIVDLVSKYNACPNKTYRSSKRAKKKVTNYYKL